MAKFFSENWCWLTWVFMATTALCGGVSWYLHARRHRPFTDPRNIGSFLAMASLSLTYALLSWVDTYADAHDQQDLREEAAGYLYVVKLLGVFGLAVVGLYALRHRDTIEVIRDVNVHSEYHYLFSGFTGERFIGYGAPFIADANRQRTDAERVALARVQLERLARIDHAIYMFHTTEAFENGKRFFEEVVFGQLHRLVADPVTRGRINRANKVVLFAPRADLSHTTDHPFVFFLGYRGGAPCCILYPVHRIDKREKPQVALLLNNDRHCFRLFDAFFQEQYEAALKDDGRHVRYGWCPAPAGADPVGQFGSAPTPPPEGPANAPAAPPLQP